MNCGSVGKPKDGDPRAALAVIDTTDEGVAVTIERVAYNARAVAREVAAAGLPAEFADKWSSPHRPAEPRPAPRGEAFGTFCLVFAGTGAVWW